MEGAICLSRCRLPRAPQREELAEVDVDWLIAERPGKVRTLKQHPRKNKTAINIEYMKASIRAKVEHPVSHHQATVRLRESQIQGVAEKR
jgi:IS5 family transposase